MKHAIRLALLFALTACGAPESEVNVDDLANEYLFLELSMGEHDKAHVDAYFGPEAFRDAAQKEAMSLDAISLAAEDLRDRLLAIDPGEDEMLAMRINSMVARIRALHMRIAINLGNTVDFDIESMALFGSQAPTYDAAHFQAILDQIDALLPGDEPLSARVEAFNSQFDIPLDKLPAVFEAAMNECRRRTLEFIELPANENFTIEYVSDKSWSGYNWYQGDAKSLIQVNTDYPIGISRAVDLGCHEGYPGHHTFNALVEVNLVQREGWVEFSLYPLFSPQSLIAEGSGNYGIELAFPGDERIAFEKAVLFPLAGIDPDNADLYYELQSLTSQLRFAGNEAARGYLNGTMTREEAAQWLVDYAMAREDKSLQRTRFFDDYRSYVINYNHGLAMVRDYVEAGDPDEAERWARFTKMLSSPLLPSDL